jgi:hypothetical protein
MEVVRSKGKSPDSPATMAAMPMSSQSLKRKLADHPTLSACSSSMHTTSKKRSKYNTDTEVLSTHSVSASLIGLPRELRDQIWSHVVGYTKVDPTNCGTRTPQSSCGESSATLLLRTCKQVADKVERVLFHQTLFVFYSYKKGIAWIERRSLQQRNWACRVELGREM